MTLTQTDEIVISGISGRYPESDSVDEFSDNLYNNVDMITDDERRFPKSFNGCPMSSGKLKSAEKFDAKFFGVSDWEADYMDAQIRAMLETTYEAICDSGTPVETLSGTNTGVFIGQYMDEELFAYRDYTQLMAYKNFMSQTVANKFNLIGPTFSADAACASSFVALNEAFLAIKYGRCDAALAIGVNISFNPGIQYNFFKLNMISPDSKCMCLDERANGYAKGEGCVTVLLQRRPNAKRVYATVVNIMSNNDGYKADGITFPSWQRQRTVIAGTYAQCGIDPKRVDYVEAHCTGTKAGDPVEMRAICEAMSADKRDRPLMIGALKSNIGHTEGASGLCAVTKVILSFENELIPSNLHFRKANPNIPALIKGYLKPINKNTSFTGDLVGLNNFGFGGSNTHVILRSPKITAPVDNDKILDTYPRLVQICGRNEAAIQHFFNKLFEKPSKITRHLLHLINEWSKTTPFDTNTGCRPMKYRGFTLITDYKPQLNYTKTQTQKVGKSAKQLCFIYTGIGSQWPAMGQKIMAFDVISKSIHKSANILKDNDIDVDLLDLLTKNTSDVNKCAINSMISLIAIQIALTDLMKHLDLIPDCIVGYSTGEIVCAYADSCITAKEALLIGYNCGQFIDNFVDQKGLKRKYRECMTNDSNSQCWDQYYENVMKDTDMTANVETLLEAVNKVISSDRQKSPKWLTNIGDTNAKFITGKYFIDSLLLPVLSRNTFTTGVNNNAVIVDISADSLLATEIENFGQNYSYIPLMKRVTNNCDILLTSLGRLYTQGYNVSIEKLYPPVSGPAPTGTRILSPFIAWDHQKSYRLTKFPDYFNFLNSKEDESYTIDFMDKNDQYIRDHCIDGKILVPATGYLLFAWKSLAFHKNILYKEFAVEFSNVQIFRATPVQVNGKCKLYTQLDPSTGRFHIVDAGTVVVSGTIREINGNTDLQFKPIMDDIKMLDNTGDSTGHSIVMKSKDIYKQLRTRGYNYGPNFQCITQSYEINDTYVWARVQWRDNWVTFSDCVLQTYILGKKSKQLMVPVAIELLRCDPRVLFGRKPGDECQVVFDPLLNIAVTDGLEIRGLRASPLQRNVKSQTPALRRYEFVAFDQYFKHKNQNYLMNYRRVCDESALNLANNNKVIGGQHEKSLLSSIPEESQTINKLLMSLSGDMSGTNIETVIEDLDKDVMYLSFSGPNYLRSPITIVMENRNELSGNSLDVLEVNESSESMFGAVMSALDIYQYQLDINYTLCHRNDHKIDSKQYSQELIISDSCIGPEVVDESVDLIVYRDQSLCHLPANDTSNADINTLFASFGQKLAENGFLLIVLKNEMSFADKFICKTFGLKPYDSSRRDTIVTQVQSLGFHLISDKSDCLANHLILFRKPMNEPIDPTKQIFIKFTNEYHVWLTSLKQMLVQIGDKPSNQNIWLMANGPDEGLLGFMKCLRKEPNGHRVRCLQILDTNDDQQIDYFLDVNKNFILNDIIKKDLAINVLKDGKVGDYVLEDLPIRPNRVDSEHCFLNLRNRGDLSSFDWFECQHKYWPLNRSDNEKLVHIYYSALNFKDIMLATGRLQAESPTGDTECLIGFEFSGRDETMNRVMGMVSSKALATTCLVKNRDFLWPIPEHWSLEEAATVPCVYATAYYALIIRGRLRPNETVLIHSGSGGVGQAAIRICLSLNCPLYITVGSDRKRQFLQRLFPTLGDHCFSTSRDLTFKQHVMTQTNGRGVDVILNSLSEEKLYASLECLATNGRFLEIGKYDFIKDSILNVTDLLRNKTFDGIQVDTLFVVNDKTSPKMLKDREHIWELISDGIQSGVVRPLDRTVYGHQQCEQAFRFMASGRHIGKVLVQIRPEEPFLEIIQPFETIKMAAIPRTVFLFHKTYIITGGLGGMGLEIIDWMIERGARNFVVTSRTGPKQPYQYSRLKYFKDIGVHVIIWTKPINTVSEATDLIAESLKLGPIGGIFHLSLVLSDGLVVNQSVESFDKVFEPKSKSLVILDQLARQMCPHLDYFVVFSSAVTCHGNAGQSNYGFTNSVMERLCERRRMDGLPALAIQWGLVGDVGYVADNITADDYVLGATRSQRLYSCLQTLDKLLQQSEVTICSSVVFNDTHRRSDAMGGDRKDLLTTVSHIMGHKDIHKFDAKTRLSELGMDSLMSVEIKQHIERDFEIVLSTQEIQNLTIERIRLIGSSGGSKSLAPTVTGQTQSANGSNESVITEHTFQIPTEKYCYLNDRKDGRKVFYLPPTDGTYHLFAPVAVQLNRPVIGLNWTDDCLRFSSIRETAQHFLDVIHTSFWDQLSDGFDLIGYSYGVFVAYDMCLVMQGWPLPSITSPPKLIALDMCPVQAQHDLRVSLAITQDIFGGDLDLQLMFSFLMDKCGVDSQEFEQLVASIEPHCRIEAVANIFMDKCGSDRLSAGVGLREVMFALESHVLKVRQTINYPIIGGDDNDQRLANDVLLLRADQHILLQSDQSPELQRHSVANDYGFNEIITGKCIVKELDGNHTKFLANNPDSIYQDIDEYLKN